MAQWFPTFEPQHFFFTLEKSYSAQPNTIVTKNYKDLLALKFTSQWDLKHWANLIEHKTDILLILNYLINVNLIVLSVFFSYCVYKYNIWQFVFVTKSSYGVCEKNTYK